MPKLVLGTAQIGIPYGIRNRTGQPDLQSACSIIREAWDQGISEFDTAQNYGTSEIVLGEALKSLGLIKKSHIISKFDPSLDHFSSQDLSKAMDRTLLRLGVENIFGMLVHQEGLIDAWNNGISQAIQPLVQSGKITNVGVSVYSPSNALKALAIREIDIIQLPSNLWDRRFENTGVFQRATEKGKKIFIRSIFLQGLLLMDPDEIPVRMAEVRPFLQSLDLLTKNFGLTRQALALGFLNSEVPGARLIFGAETRDQVRDTVENAGKIISSELKDQIKKLFAQVPETILNPSLWP